MRWTCMIVAPVLCLLFAVGSARAGEDEAAAKAAFAEGKAAFADERFTEAADSFREAYELKPSWKLLYNIGQAEAAGKRYGSALEAFERYLAEGGDDVSQERQREVQKEIARLKGMVGFLKVTAPTGAVVSVNGVERGTAPLTHDLPVTASVSLVVKATAVGEILAEQSTQVSGGRTAEVNLTPETPIPIDHPAVVSGGGQAPTPSTPSTPSTPPTPSTSPSPLKTWGWISVGIGGALLVGGGITGGLALGKNADLENKCEADGCYSSEYDLMDRRDGLATAGTVLIISGGVLAATGIVLLIAGRDGETESSSVALLPGPGGFVLEGRF